MSPSEEAMRQARSIVEAHKPGQSLSEMIALALDRRAATERERCAQIVEGWHLQDMRPAQIAAAIRSR